MFQLNYIIRRKNKWKIKNKRELRKWEGIEVS